MSNEAVTLLIKKAKEIDERAQKAYDTGLAVLVKKRGEEQKRYATLLTAAQDVCEHTEEEKTHHDSYDYHNNVDASYNEYHCKTCGTYLRTTG